MARGRGATLAAAGASSEPPESNVADERRRCDPNAGTRTARGYNRAQSAAMSTSRRDGIATMPPRNGRNGGGGRSKIAESVHPLILASFFASSSVVLAMCAAGIGVLLVGLAASREEF